MGIRFRFFIILSLLMILFFPSCNDLLVDDISFKVITSGAGFSGYYIADDGDMKNFESNVLVGGFSFFEKKVEIYSSLIVVINTYSGASSAEIKVFRNEVLVKETSLNSLTEPTNLSLNYRYGEENTQQENTQN